MTRGGAAANSPAPGIDRLGVAPHIWGTECASGLGSDDSSFAGTSWPQPLGQAATWDTNLVRAVAVASHVELRAQVRPRVGLVVGLIVGGLRIKRTLVAM